MALRRTELDYEGVAKVGKRKARRRKSNWPKPKIQPQMTQDDLIMVEKWFARMKTNVSKAIKLSQEIPCSDLNDSNNLVWALVKYVENVQECAIQLDEMKRSILESLDEVPIKSCQGEDLTWSNMKGMRNILAHKFWAIDLHVLRETAMVDFPILDSLLSQLVFDASVGNSDLPTFRFPVRRFRELPLFRPEDGSTLGNTLIMMWFNKKGKARCMRIARQSDSKIAIKWPDDLKGTVMSISLLGDEQNEAESLGEFLL